VPLKARLCALADEVSGVRPLSGHRFHFAPFLPFRRSRRADRGAVMDTWPAGVPSVSAAAGRRMMAGLTLVRPRRPRGLPRGGRRGMLKAGSFGLAPGRQAEEDSPASASAFASASESYF